MLIGLLNKIIKILNTMKADWVKVSPSSGSGNATVNVSSVTPHTGRVARTTVLTWKAANVTDVPRTVNQAGKPEHVDIDDSASADKGGKRVTISGVSNSKKLTFTLSEEGSLDVTLPSSYIANSVETINGANIAGDPGESAEYNFSITIDVPANTTTTAKSRQIIVTAENGKQDACMLTSVAGDAYVRVAEGVIELNYTGDAVAVSVESNTNWTVE